MGLSLIGSGVAAAAYRAGDCCQTYQPQYAAACAPCTATCVQYQTVERTVMVPTYVTEMREAQITCYRPEQRQREFTVHRQVPHIRTTTQAYTIHVPETRTKVVNYTVAKPVYETRAQEYT